MNLVFNCTPRTFCFHLIESLSFLILNLIGNGLIVPLGKVLTSIKVVEVEEDTDVEDVDTEVLLVDVVKLWVVLVELLVLEVD